MLYQKRGWKTHSEEDPLKHLAVVSRLFRHVKPEFVFAVIVLREIKHDGSCLEDRESLRSGCGRSVPVNQDGDFAVGVQGVDVPWLLLPVGSDRDVLDAGGDRMVRYRSYKPIHSLICDFVAVDALQLLEIN